MDAPEHTDVPHTDLLDRIRSCAGPVLFLGASDTGKTGLVSRLARAACSPERPAGVLDLDVGQSEVGPPGMMDLAEGNADQPLSKWRVRGQWFAGSTSPFAAPVAVAVGARRLLDRGLELGFSPLLVDTPSFVNTAAGHALAHAFIDTLRPRLIVAVQFGNEMERFLRGVSSPVHRLGVQAAVRSKPSGLRAARRAARLETYFREAPEHAIRLADYALRGTRLGFGEPLAAAECAAAATLLGCPVRRGERTSSSVALWTAGLPKRDTARAAVELGTKRLATFDAAAWEQRSLAFLAPDGLCLAMGIIEHLDWPSLSATVRAPFYGVASAAAITFGLMRFRRDGTELPPVADADA